MNASWCLRLAILIVLGNLSHGCQPQVCRRRRDVSESKYRRRYYGCTARSPSWVRPVAYCLNLPVASMALGIKTWYDKTYRRCRKDGCQKYVNKRVNENIPDCMRCWEKAILDTPELVEDFKISAEDITRCVRKFMVPYLNNDLPQLSTIGRHRRSINLAHVRPADYWWSVKVELPCKPKVFQYWNAYCINSFARDLRESDYVLVKNHLVEKEDITFYVEFSDTCTFDLDDINIIWEESTPAPALVQTSPFPSAFPPRPNETVSMYYDLEAAKRLTHIQKRGVPEYETAKLNARKDKLKKSIRKKRGADDTNLGRIGLIFPCAVASFKAIDYDSRLPYTIIGASDQFLIDANGFMENNVTKRSTQMNFTLDYGFDRTGCYFDSGDIIVVPNPPPDFFSRRPLPRNKRISCITCVNRINDMDCLDRGEKKYCERDEVCQTEVRQIAGNFRLVTKTCKQKNACDTNSRGKKSGQCRPGEPGSVCRCCCNTDMCNVGNTSCYP